jgi:hypothetical protein
MLALSIRQPYAELILRGIKTIEYRSKPTRIVGQRFYIYAAKAVIRDSPMEIRGKKFSRVTGTDNLSTESPAPWMLELATALRLFPADLPRGVIVGSAIIERVEIASDASLYQWHLRDIRRLSKPRKPTGHPQPVWFDPFPIAA